MLALAKALLLLARYIRRITVCLERMEALYRLQLRSQGIYESDPDITDEVEVTYGTKITDPDNMDDPDLSR